MTLRLAAFVVWASTAAWAQVPAAGDTLLSDAVGQTKKLSEYFGQPVLIIYEDRGSQSQNAEFKNELAQIGKDASQRHLVRLLAIANLRPFNWFPARQFAQASVRASELNMNIPILIDWTGNMSQPPWQLPSDQSSVLVLDAEGNVLFRRSGALLPEERATALSLLRQLVASSREVNVKPMAK